MADDPGRLPCALAGYGVEIVLGEGRRVGGDEAVDRGVRRRGGGLRTRAEHVARGVAHVVGRTRPVGLDLIIGGQLCRR